jgi:hypothetical protein
LNPSPETTSEAASTCLGDCLISTPATKIVILRRHPAVLNLALDQQPNQRARIALCGRRDAIQPRRTETTLIRQP